MSAPVTPFEVSGGTAVTTLADESSVLDFIISDSGRVSKFKIGSSSINTDMYAYAVGGTSAPVMTDIKNQLLFICSQHGNESSPREAGITAIRDMAYTEDAQTITNLDAVPLVIVPTANPYGSSVNSRLNGNGEDINRGFLSQSPEENKVLSELINLIRPALIYDGHESGSIVTDFATETHSAGAMYNIKNLGDALESNVGDWLLPDWTHSKYALAVHEGTITNHMSSTGVLALICEARVGQTLQLKHDQHLRVIGKLHEHFVANSAYFVAGRALAGNLYVEEGINLHSKIYLYDNGWVDSPLGYLVYPAVHQELDKRRIRYIPNAMGDGRSYVPLSQEMAGIIPPLVDTRAARPSVAAEAVFSDVPLTFYTRGDGYTKRQMKMNLSGVPQRVHAIKFHGNPLEELIP